jgi:hypothetical protein
VQWHLPPQNLPFVLLAVGKLRVPFRNRCWNRLLSSVLGAQRILHSHLLGTSHAKVNNFNNLTFYIIRIKRVANIGSIRQS